MESFGEVENEGEFCHQWFSQNVETLSASILRHMREHSKEQMAGYHADYLWELQLLYHPSKSCGVKKNTERFFPRNNDVYIGSQYKNITCEEI